jgi:hypothetical protein
MRLRAMSNALEICKYILETTRLPSAQFHIAICLREVIVQNWYLYTKETREEWRNYVIRWISSHLNDE